MLLKQPCLTNSRCFAIKFSENNLLNMAIVLYLADII